MGEDSSVENPDSRRKGKVIAWALVGLLIVSFSVAASVKHAKKSPKGSPTPTLATPAEPATAVVELHSSSSLSACEAPDYSSKTLKLAHEMPVLALFGKPMEGSVFEASCIARVDDFFYTVSDDSPNIAKIRNKLQYNDPQNVLIEPSKPFVIQSSIMAAAQAAKAAAKTTTAAAVVPPAAEEHTEAGFEALVYDKDTDTFSAVIEAISLSGTGDSKFHSVIFDLKINHDTNTYNIIRECPSDYEFTSSNKGFEGAVMVKKDGTQYLLGLCEGNFCEGGQRGKTPGNGRVVLLKRGNNVELHGKTYECVWQVQRVINLPKSLQFRDYSAITLRGDRVAIASQENSQVWMGRMNLDTFEFITAGERMFDFPKNDDCGTQYCNVEGLDFISDSLLVAASDQMKDMGRQSFRCLSKDQSIHVFVIPPLPEPPLAN